MYNFYNKIYSNNNNLLLGIINDLQQINYITHDNLVIKRIGDIIIKINFIINENKKNTELIINHISLLQNKMNKKFDELKFNNINQINKQDIKYTNGSRYIGQVVNGLREGKGIYYYNDGERYEGDWKKEGKGIYYFKNGNRFEGEFKNNNLEGKGIYYYYNGDREIGDWKDGKKIGKHVIFTENGEVKTENY